jgi:predicted transposase YbfD/YdcC
MRKRGKIETREQKFLFTYKEEDMFAVPVTNIAKYFSEVDDPRVDRTKDHLLIDIITIAICAVISGADGWVDVENYGTAKYTWLSTFLALPNGIPSHDTFGRVFARINPKQFQACFIRWIRAIYRWSAEEVIPIDGKTLRHSFDTELEQSPIHMVSAWASTNRLVLGQLKTDEKSNEITAIPELLRALDITGCIITLDAMGCQKAIARQIIEQHGTYVLALKANQEWLYEDVCALFTHLIATNDSRLDYYETYDESHGRKEVRRYWTTSFLDTLRSKEQWNGLVTVGMAEYERKVTGETTKERRFHILSFHNNAEKYGSAVRAHWGIENELHWVLDMAFREDECRIRMDHGPENFALLRHIALNLLRQEKTYTGSIVSKRRRAGWNDAYLAKVVGVNTM